MKHSLKTKFYKEKKFIISNYNLFLISMSKLVWHLIIPMMPCTKQCPHRPTPDLTPQPPPPRNSDSEPDYGDPDETALLASIPVSEVTLKSPSPQKKQWAAASAAISSELEEEKKKDPMK